MALYSCISKAPNIVHALVHHSRTILLLCLLFATLLPTQFTLAASQENPLWTRADENGEAARQAFLHCRDFVRGWLQFADPRSGLIPRGLKQDYFWNARDAAADNYPFMVLTASFVDEDLCQGRLLDILHAEKRLCSRVGALPDDFLFETQAFRNNEIDMPQLIFGASEYVKDGLLPLTEWLGHSPWLDRAIELTDAIIAHAEVESPVGPLPHASHEVAGEMLQVLSRFYWMTKNEDYKEMAFRLTDFFLLHALPTEAETLKLRDHGCEVIGGLSESYFLASRIAPEKYKQYHDPMHKMLDRILEVGRNKDGLFYNRVDPIKGTVLSDGLSDNWGYDYNAFLTVAEVDNHEPYREAVRFALSNIHKYKDYDWENGSADGYADSIESGLNLLNRYPDDTAFDWVEYSMNLMLSIQRDDGIVEGWHGDGNYARTAIMYALWKSKGTRVSPWRADIRVGAEIKADADGGRELWVSVQSDWPWQGRLIFDGPRHREIFSLPVDYPRLNQFPEWFSVEKTGTYNLYHEDGQETEITGGVLRDGIAIQTDAKTPVHIRVKQKN
ncbi:MAG: hypothetical protein ABIH23_12230 [bacterium]